MENMKNISQSNEYLIQLIKSNKPFMITRVGIGSETILTCYWKLKCNIPNNIMYALDNNAGIYRAEKNVELFGHMYASAIANSDALAVWKNMLIKEQKILMKGHKLVSIYSRVLEPFYCILENIKPWSHYLLGKKVLIINPFVESFQKQLRDGFQMFKDKDIFLDGQEFVFYRPFMTTAGNHLHSNWLETYRIMRDDISALDFDIALLGCGGYGLPLCNHIRTHMGKSAIYIGGGLQLLFGVMGKRWENIPLHKKIIEKNNTEYIRPSGDEILLNKKRVENGCYW
jgi:hypothetical protein